MIDSLSPYTQALADHEVEIPETINTQTLVKDLAKEIRLVEVNSRITDRLCLVLLYMCVCRNITIFLFY